MSTYTRDPSAKVLILDYDGLLVDTETPYWRDWMAVFRHHEVDVQPQHWAGLMMKNHCPSSLLRDRFGIHLSPAQVREINGGVFAQIEANGMMDGAIDLLESAKQQGWTIALSTNASEDWLELTKPKELRQTTYFDIIEVDAGKPRPDSIRRICKTAHVSPAQAAGADDTSWGVKAFVRAGVRVLHVPSEPYKDVNIENVQRRESLVGVTADSLADLLWPEPSLTTPSLGLEPTSALQPTIGLQPMSVR